MNHRIGYLKNTHLYFSACTFISLLILCSCRPDTKGHDRFAKVFVFYSYQEDGQGGYEVGTLSNYAVNNSGFFYSFHQKSINPDGGVLAPSPVIIDEKAQKIEQCGTYDIIINDHGVVTKISDFTYNGEYNLLVARGIGWSMYISREDWKH